MQAHRFDSCSHYAQLRNGAENVILFVRSLMGPRQEKEKQEINVTVRTVYIFMYVKDHHTKAQLLN